MNNDEQLSLQAKVILAIVGTVITFLFASGAMKDPAMEQKQYQGSCWKRVANSSENMEICK